MRVLIVDDEAPARAKVRKLLAVESDVEVVGEAADGDAAVAAIEELRPDVVFLDIQMPKRDGFGVVEEVGVDEMPAVVFVTAFDEHALRAFEVHALDYLLKPFAPSRFQRVLERVRRSLERERSAELARRMDELLASVRPEPRYLKRLQVKIDDEREILLRLDRVEVIRAQGNYLRFHTKDGVYSRRGTLTELCERLDPEQFLRINRSEVVRLDAVRELQPWFHGDYHVVLHDGTRLSWSRRYRAKDGPDL